MNYDLSLIYLHHYEHMHTCTRQCAQSVSLEIGQSNMRTLTQMIGTLLKQQPLSLFYGSLGGVVRYIYIMHIVQLMVHSSELNSTCTR